MKEELEKYAAEALEWLRSGAAWIAEEIPLYVEEILRWALWESVVNLIGAVLLTILFGIVLPIVTYRISKRIVEELEDESAYSINLADIIWGIILLFPIASVYDNIMNIVKISVAPRVYLIEYLSNLVGG